MIGTPPKVGIALLNWNQYGDTALCLRSLRESEYRPAIIMVYDNGSADGSGERLQAEFPEIQMVKGGQNYGFSEGNNRAVKILLEAGMDLVWILNNDTKVPPDCLGTLVRALEDDPGIGAVSAKIWFMNERKPICYAGATFNPWTFNTTFRGLRETDRGQYDQAEDTDVFTGCCMLVRADVLRQIGLFHKDFFIYADDVEWSVRARAAGLRLRYEPRATLWHKMYGSSTREGQWDIPKSSARVEFLLSRNRFLMVRLHTKPASFRRLFALSYYIVRRFSRAVALVLLKSRRTAGIGTFKGIWAGLWMQPDPAGSKL